MMLLDYLLTDGKAYTRSLEFMITVQSLKYDEYIFRIFWIETDAIVHHGYLVKMSALFCHRLHGEITGIDHLGIYVDDRVGRLLPELNGIAEQVIEQLAHQARDHPQHRKIRDENPRIRVLNLDFQFRNCLLDQDGQIRLPEVRRTHRVPREAQEIVNQ